MDGRSFVCYDRPVVMRPPPHTFAFDERARSVVIWVPPWAAPAYPSNTVAARPQGWVRREAPSRSPKAASVTATRCFGLCKLQSALGSQG